MAIIFQTLLPALEILSNIPILLNKINNAVPPALKNGNGIPVLGIDEVTTPIFSITCIATKLVIPNSY